MASALFAGDNLLIIAGGLLFVAIILVVFAVSGFAGASAQPDLRLPEAAEPELPQLAIEDNVLRRVARFVTPTRPEELGEARLRLSRAGYRRPSAVRIYYLGRSLFGLGIAFLAAVIVPMALKTAPFPIVLAIMFGALMLGFLIPSMLLDRKINQRRAKAEEGFPDMLDMLLVCIEAGQGFEQAARRIARELIGHNDVLAEELSILNSELWAGRDRNAAFRDFALRLNVDDISAFVTVLRHADQYGVSIADAIRVYASDMRYKRVMRAEEKANVMPLKVALASMMFTIPPTIIIMIGPSILEIAHSLAGR